MKKVKCFIAIAAFALYVSACSGSRTSTTTSPGITDSSGTTSPYTPPGNTTDSSHQR